MLFTNSENGNKQVKQLKNGQTVASGAESYKYRSDEITELLTTLLNNILDRSLYYLRWNSSTWPLF